MAATADSRRPLPFPLLCIGCGVVVVVAALLLCWLTRSAARLQAKHNQQQVTLCAHAATATKLLDARPRSVASVRGARKEAGMAVQQMQALGLPPTLCQLHPPRANDLHQLLQEALNAGTVEQVVVPPMALVNAEPALISPSRATL